MKKMFVINLVIVFVFLSLNFISCGCEHEKLSFIEDTATCESNGVKRYKCEECGEIIENYSQQIEHDFSIFVEDTATCEEDGYTTYKCCNCSETNSKKSEKKGHSYKGCVCERCNIIQSGYKKTTVLYTSGKFHYYDYYTNYTGSNYVVLSIDINSSNGSIDYYYGGKIYFYGSTNLLDFYIKIYDLEGNLIVNKMMGYIPSSGKFFSSEGNIESSRTLENGEECYIYLNVKQIAL